MIELNRVLLVGRLTRDPETRYTSGGTAVASFSIAVNRRRGRDKEDETSFIDCEAWDRTAEFVQQWFQKGKPIFVEGRLRMDRWQDKQSGQNRSKLLVVAERASFVGGKEDSPGGGGEGDGGSYGGDDSPSEARSGGQSGVQSGGAPRGGQRPSPARGSTATPPPSSGGDGETDDDLPF